MPDSALPPAHGLVCAQHGAGPTGPLPSGQDPSAEAAARRRGARRRGAIASVCGVAGIVAVAAVVLQPGARASAAAADAQPMRDPGEGALRALGSPLGQARLLPYPVDFVWPAAVRYLRVDRKFTIVDRDLDAGFILFEFPLGGGDGKTARGSVEIFATKDPAGRASAQVQIDTDGGPTYLPHALMDGIAEKVKRERGQPAPPPPKDPPGAPGKPREKTPPGAPPDQAPAPGPKPPVKPLPPPDDDGDDGSLIVDG